MAALLRRGTLGDRIEDVLRHVRLDSLMIRLMEFRVLGLFGNRLLAHAPSGSLTPEFVQSIAAVVDAGRRGAIGNQRLTWAVLRLLAADGIQAVPLKGPFLAERLHGDPGLRLSHDVDVLVSPGSLKRAGEVLSNAGYLPPSRDAEPHLLHDKLDVPGGIPVELHWRIHWNDDQHADRMLSRASFPEDLSHFCLTDDLTSLLLVYSRDGLVGLSAPADIAAWWERYGADLDRNDFASSVAAQPRLAPAIRAAATLTQRLTGVPIVDLLPDDGRGRRRTQLAVSVAADMLFEHDLRQDTLPKLTDLLLVTEPGGRAYLKRTFLPPLSAEGYGQRANRVIYDVGLVRRVLGLIAVWLIQRVRRRR